MLEKKGVENKLMYYVMVTYETLNRLDPMIDK